MTDVDAAPAEKTPDRTARGDLASSDRRDLTERAASDVLAEESSPQSDLPAEDTLPRPTTARAESVSVTVPAAGADGASAPPAQPEVAAERPLGARFLIGELLGRGAMGRVYRGRARAGGPAVAIKVLRDDLTQEPEVVARFVQERQLLQAVNHPHVVSVHDLVLDGDDLAIVMDLVDGGDLRRAVPWPCPPDQAMEIAAQLAEAVAAVHAAGIIHRDVKPANILCERDDHGTLRVRLTDFGVSRLLNGTLTRVTSLIGTPGYLAPEVTLGLKATEAADVYALGVVLFELLTGQPPFSADNAHALMRAHSDDNVPQPEGLPEPTWTVLSAMLAKDPAARPEPSHLAAQLRAVAPEIANTGPFPLPATAIAAAHQRPPSAPAPTVDQKSGAAPDDEREDPEVTVVKPGPAKPLAEDRGPARTPWRTNRGPGLFVGGAVASTAAAQARTRLILGVIVLLVVVGGGLAVLAWPRSEMTTLVGAVTRSPTAESVTTTSPSRAITTATQAAPTSAVSSSIPLSAPPLPSQPRPIEESTPAANPSAAPAVSVSVTTAVVQTTVYVPVVAPQVATPAPAAPRPPATTAPAFKPVYPPMAAKPTTSGWRCGGSWTPAPGIEWADCTVVQNNVWTPGVLIVNRSSSPIDVTVSFMNSVGSTSSENSVQSGSVAVGATGALWGVPVDGQAGQWVQGFNDKRICSSSGCVQLGRTFGPSQHLGS